MLTDEQIDAGKSPRGGWTKAQLAEWGIPWPPPKGWKSLLIGGPVKRKPIREEDVLFAVTGLPEDHPDLMKKFDYPPWEEGPAHPERTP